MDGSVLSEILDVFSAVGTWIVSATNSLTPMFWNATDSALTFLGVLAVSGLSLSVAFLLIGIIQRFLHFAG